MIWFVSSDTKYYKDVSKLKKEYNLNKIIFLPDKEDIKSALSDEDVGFLSNVYPSEEYHSFMVVKELSKKEILTSQQKKYGVTEEEVLHDLFGLQVSRPKITIENDLIGQKQIHLLYEEIKNNIINKKPTSPIFELGVPGVGKTHSVSCLAGSLGYILIQLNLTLFVERGQGVNLLHQFFQYINDTKPPCIILFDEFENMVENKAIMGAMLSILGALNDKDQGGYEFNEQQILIATANNISDIVSAKPQFFRLGRWSHKFFFSFPTLEDSTLTIQYYFEIEGIKYDKIIYEEIKIKFCGIHTANYTPGRSIYSQVELKHLIRSFDGVNLESLRNDDEDKYNELLENHIQNITPSQVNSKEGLTQLLADAETNMFKNVDD